uniref:NTR domain-containing protein n=1 Tax=Romanomermis culicivorax TaxID=13658 RepID=A0A915J0B7_ROMCU
MVFNPADDLRDITGQKVAIFPPEYWIDSTPNNIWICSEENVTLLASLNSGLNRVAAEEHDILAVDWSLLIDGNVLDLGVPCFTTRWDIFIRSRISTISGKITRIAFPPFDQLHIINDDRRRVYRLTIRIKSRSESLIEDFYIESRPEIRWIEIYTDKSIYRQKETVKVKIVTLKANFHISSSPLLVRIKDPNSLTVFKDVFNNTGQSGLVQFSFILPRHSSCGTWLIEAVDAGSNLLIINRTFSVAVFALPNLQVVIVPSKIYFTNLNESVDLMISVRSNYGFDVNGKAYVICYFEKGAERRFSVQLQKGKGYLDLRLNECISNSSNTINIFSTEKLFVSVEYTDLDTGEQSYQSVVLAKRKLFDIDLSFNENSQHITEYLVPRIFSRDSTYLNFSKFEYEVTEDIEAHLIDKYTGNNHYLVYCMNGFTLMGKINQSKPFNLRANVSMIPECLLMLYNLSHNGFLVVNDVLKFFVKSKCNADGDTELSIVGPLRDLYDSFIQKKLTDYKNFDSILNNTVPSCQNDRNCYKSRTDPFISSESEFPGLEVISGSRLAVDSADLEILRRHFFPESWMFEAFLPRDKESIVLEKTIPHSITDWIVRVHIFSGQYGVCEKSFSIKTTQNLYLHIDLPTNVFVGQQILAKVVIVNSSPKDEHVSLEIKHPKEICSAKPLFDVHETSIRAQNSTFLIVPFEFLNEGQFEIEMTLKSRNDANLIFDRNIKSVDVIFDSNQWEQKSLYFMIDTNNYSKYNLPNINHSHFEMSFLRDNRTGQNVNVVLIALRNEKALHVQRVKFQMSVSPNVLKFDDSGMIEQENRFLSKLIKRELWPKIEKVDQLSDLLRLISIVLKIVGTFEADASRSGQLLIESRQLLNYALLDMLSFRNRDGSFRGRRDPKSRADSWLSLISTLLQCRMDQDFTAIKASLTWLLDSYEKVTFKFNEITFLFKNSDEISLFSNVFLKMAVECMEYARKDSNINVRLNSSVNLIKARLYSIDVRSVDNLIISSMAYALSDSNSSFSGKLLESLFNDSTKKDGRLTKIYYTPRSSSAFEKLKHTARRLMSWFTTSYRKRLTANELLTNSFALLTILKTNELTRAFSNRNVYIPGILAYIRMHQQTDEGFNDFLDTFFALEAVQLYDRIVGAKRLYDEDRNLPIIEKYCNDDGSTCWCLEITCPNPSVHNDQCDMFCRDREDRTLLKYACNRNYYSVIVRIEEISANVSIHGSLYENASVSVMSRLSASVDEINYSRKFSLLKKAFCACPKFEIDRVYVLIVPKDYISRQIYGSNHEKRSLLIVLDVNTIMEAVFDSTCDDTRQMNVLRLLEDRNRSVLCQSL